MDVADVFCWSGFRNDHLFEKDLFIRPSCTVIIFCVSVSFSFGLRAGSGI